MEMDDKVAMLVVAAKLYVPGAPVRVCGGLYEGARGTAQGVWLDSALEPTVHVVTEDGKVIHPYAQSLEIEKKEAA